MIGFWYARLFLQIKKISKADEQQFNGFSLTSAKTVVAEKCLT